MFIANWLDRFPASLAASWLVNLTTNWPAGRSSLLCSQGRHFLASAFDGRKHVMLKKIITVKVKVVFTLICLTSHKESLHSQAQALGRREQTWRSSRHWAGTWNINIPGTWKFLLDLTSDTFLQINLFWQWIYFHLTGFSWVAFLNSVRLVPARETPFRKTSLWSSLALVDSNHWKCWKK